MKVYIADDSSEIRIRLSRMLKEIEGVEIIGEAVNGVSAIQDIRDLHPELIILDIRMPMINGLDVLKTLVDASYKPVIIVLTQYPYPQYREKCIELGADYFLEKSGEIEQVLTIVQNLAQQAA